MKKRTKQVGSTNTSNQPTEQAPKRPDKTGFESGPTLSSDEKVIVEQFVKCPAPERAAASARLIDVIWFKVLRPQVQSRSLRRMADCVVSLLKEELLMQSKLSVQRPAVN